MPKMKTHRASAKRFKRTANGGLKRHHAFTGHRFHGKTKKQRRHLRKAAMVSSSDMKRIKQMVAQREEAIALIDKAKKSKKSMAEAYKIALEMIQNNPILDTIEGEDRVLRHHAPQMSPAARGIW